MASPDARAALRGIVKRDFHVPSSAQRGLTLCLHAVAPAAGARRAALLLHGATLSGFIFDPPPPAPSWQERLAARGWASYALDLRGFGGSSRPAPGDAGFDERRPFAGAGECVADVADAVRFLTGARGHGPISLVGFSWGTLLAARYAAAQPEALDRLLLYAPIYATPHTEWLARLGDPRDPAAFNPAFGAYRWTTAQALHERWDADIPVADKRAWRADDVLDAVLRGALRSDALAASRTPPAFRAPNGPFADLHLAYSGRPGFDPAAIPVPVMLVRGEGDSTSTDADARALLRDLGPGVRRYRTVIRGSHWTFFERSAQLLFDACEEFLED